MKRIEKSYTVTVSFTERDGCANLQREPYAGEIRTAVINGIERDNLVVEALETVKDKDGRIVELEEHLRAVLQYAMYDCEKQEVTNDFFNAVKKARECLNRSNDEARHIEGEVVRCSEPKKADAYVDAWQFMREQVIGGQIVRFTDVNTLETTKCVRTMDFIDRMNRFMHDNMWVHPLVVSFKPVWMKRVEDGEKEVVFEVMLSELPQFWNHCVMTTVDYEELEEIEE